MLDDDRRRGSQVDEGKLLLVREFLRREFRDCHHRDFFAFDQAAQVFLIETGRGFRHALVIPKATFDHPDFAFFCNAQLADALQQARGFPLTLRPDGAK